MSEHLTTQEQDHMNSNRQELIYDLQNASYFWSTRYHEAKRAGFMNADRNLEETLAFEPIDELLDKLSALAVEEGVR